MGPYRVRHVPRKPIMQSCPMVDIMLSEKIGSWRHRTRTVRVKRVNGCGILGDQICQRKSATGTISKFNKLKICTWIIQGLSKVGKKIGYKNCGSTYLGNLLELTDCFTTNATQSISGVALTMNKSIKEFWLRYTR